MTTTPLTVRDLGPRGSRGVLADSDPAGPIPEAAAAVLASAAEWWESRAEEAGLSGQWLNVAHAVSAPMPTAAQSTRAAPGLRNASPTTLGATYTAALSSATRARHGRHYTPPDLAEHLWAMVREALHLPRRATQLPGLVRDRACGAGSLLLPAMREHVTASTRVDAQLTLAALPSLVEGIDADPNAVWLANVALAAEALPLLAAVPHGRRKPFEALVRCGDGLLSGQRPARIEVQNPPYGRVRLGPAEREKWSRLLYGHANLYGLFIGAALENLDEQGVLAALVPTSFTSGLYFSKLRDTLSLEAPLRAATFVEERDGVFSNVLQETCLTVFSRRRSRWTSVASVNGHVQPVARVKSPRGDRPWLLPRRPDDALVAASAASLPDRLADVGYRCSTGPLVWNRRQSDLSSIQTRDAVPVVWAADIDGGRLHRDRARDGLRFLRLSGSDQRVMVLDHPAVMIQRTNAPEQSRRLVVADFTEENLSDWGGRVVVENHVNVLRPIVDEPVLSRPTLAAVLATGTIDRVIRSLSGSVALSAYEIESIPFPPAETLRTWKELSGEALEQAVARAYDLNDAAP